jgi:hypothetical protein
MFVSVLHGFNLYSNEIYYITGSKTNNITAPTIRIIYCPKSDKNNLKCKHS